MGETTIEWTDKTWNPVTGCTKVSPGCKFCYAERVFPRPYSGMCVCDHKRSHHLKQVSDNRTHYVPCTVPGCGCVGFKARAFTDVRTHPDRLDQPLRWRKPARIFANSMSDLFHDEVSDEFIDKCFAVMALTPQHTYQILTKRPERMREYFSRVDVRRPIAKEANVFMRANERLVNDDGLLCFTWSSHETASIGEYTNYLAGIADHSWPLTNVWLGVSVENQQYWNERREHLLVCPASVRFISYEPALGPLTIEDGTGCNWPDWVIVGGESGHGARPFNIQWARDVVRQCKTAGVPCFVKQLGANTVEPWREGEHSESLLVEGEDASKAMLSLILDDSKGGDMSEWPEDLRVREFPEVSR